MLFYWSVYRFTEGYHNLALPVCIRIIANHSIVSFLKSLTVHIYNAYIILYIIYIYIHVILYALLSLNEIDMHPYIYTYIHIYTYIYIYTHAYIHTHTIVASCLN